MASTINVKRSPSRTRRRDFSKFRQPFQGAPTNSVSLATVGYEDEPNPAYAFIEGQGEVLVEITLQPDGEKTVARLGHAHAGGDSGVYIPVEFGCQVVVVWPQGDGDAEGVIVARLWDDPCPMPSTVAGVSTGAPGTKFPAPAIPAPAWQFIKTRRGQLLAIETGAAGDITVHAPTGNVEVKAAAAIHLDAPSCHLGASFSTPPQGARVGPAGVDIPGVPATPYIPTPATLPAPVAGPAPAIPFVGFEHSIIRAKDMYQSDITIDPIFWAFIAAVYAHPVINPVLAGAGVLLPLSVTSKSSGVNGPGSLHTASDPGGTP